MQTLLYRNQSSNVGLSSLNVADNTQRCGSPNSAVIPKKIYKRTQIVLEGRKVKLRERVKYQKVVYIPFSMNIYSRESCVQSVWTKNSKASMIQSTVWSCLPVIKRIFLYRYMTMNKTGNEHYTRKSNRQFVEWTALDESRLKRPKTQMLAGKHTAMHHLIGQNNKEFKTENRKRPNTDTIYEITTNQSLMWANYIVLIADAKKKIFGLKK